MARRFRGEGHQKVDTKGRVSIPALFRRVLEAGDPDWEEKLSPNLVIVYGDHRRKYLECFTIEAIDEVDDQITEMQRGSPERELLEELFNGQSFPTSVDETGRLVLPAKLRQKIGLVKEAYFIATGDTFQIWNPEEYEQVKAKKVRNWLDAQPEDFNVMSLLPGKKKKKKKSKGKEWR